MRRPCFPNSGSHQHGPPLLGRVRTPPRSPTSTLLCSPPTPSSPSAAAPVVPRQRPTSVRRLVLHRRTGASADRCNAGVISTPAPHKPALSRGDTRGSQVPGPSSSCVPWSSTPPGAYRPSPISRCGRCCLQASQYLGHPETYFFRGYLPTAHSLACLRFAESVTVSGARLATGRAGSPLAGRVSHPLDDKQGFMKSSHTPFPLDQPCLVARHPEFNWRDLPTCMLHEHESRGGEFVLDTNAVETFLGHKVIHGALRSGGDGLLRLARSAFAHRWGAWWNSAPRASNATRASPQAVSVSESIVSSTAAVVGSWPLFARSSRFTASRAAAANGTPAPRRGGRCSLPVHVFSDFSLDCDNRRVEAHWRLPDWRFMLPFGCRSPFALGADQDMLGLHSRTMDKAKAEVGVQIVQRWILAALRHRTFFSSANSTPRSPSSSSDSTRGRSASEPLRVFRRLILVCRTAFMRVPRAIDTRLPLHYVACGLQSLPKRSAARLSAMRAADSCTESRAR